MMYFNNSKYSKNTNKVEGKIFYTLIYMGDEKIMITKPYQDDEFKC
jgi:hypothetical protein